MLASFLPPPLPLHNPPFTYIAIDIRTVSFDHLKTPSARLTLEKAATHISKVHNKGACQKFCHEPIVTLLNSSEILLLPFTVDPYGALGYFACELFFLPSSNIPLSMGCTSTLPQYICCPHIPYLLLSLSLASLTTSYYAPVHLLSPLFISPSLPLPPSTCLSMCH
jgi:hypothetical protein